ncbi:MAG: DUF2339 domain-containing protein [Acidobacteria bacterium]|nr:DUF2339 domain-containing protein [Acidobacteriota bacterium]
MTALGAGVVYLSGYAAKAASRCESRRTDRPITAAVLGSWSAGHDRRGRQLQDLFAVQAALLATIAFPIRLDGDWITVAWTAEAVALAIAGARLPALWMRVFSVGLFGVVLLMAPQALLGQDEQLLFINLRFLTLAGAAIGLAVAGFAVRRLWSARVGQSVSASRTSSRSSPCRSRPGTSCRGSVSTWTSTSPLRSSFRPRGSCGRLLLLVVVAKTFLVDLSFLDQGYRILSFLTVGALLVAVSFLYQRRRRGDAPVE